MPSGTSINVNSNGLIPRSNMPPLIRPRPLRSDANGNANTSSAAAGDLISKAVIQAQQSVGGNIDIFA